MVYSAILAVLTCANLVACQSMCRRSPLKCEFPELSEQAENPVAFAPLRAPLRVFDALMPDSANQIEPWSEMNVHLAGVSPSILEQIRFMAVDETGNSHVHYGLDEGLAQPSKAVVGENTCLTIQDAKQFSTDLIVDNHGTIKASVFELASTAESESQQQPFSEIQTTVKDCNWNVYASAKPSKSDILINRAQPVSITSDGTAVRIGSQIFLPSTYMGACLKHINVPELSLYIDHIERQGQFLFVTSRQKITNVPDLEDKQDEEAAGDNNTVETNSDDKSNNKKRSITDSSDDSDSEGTNSSSEAESEALSAYESWSEASTDYSDSEVLQDTRPQYNPMPGDKKAGIGDGTASISEDDTSSDSNESHESDASDSDDDSVAAPNMRYAHVMDDEEEDAVCDMIWGSDEDNPVYDGDEYNGAFASDSDEEDAYDGTMDDKLSDSDSDDEKASKQKNDEEGEGEVADEAKDGQKDQEAKDEDAKSKIITTTDKDDTTHAKPSKTKEKDKEDGAKVDTEEEPELIGTSTSQLHVYDLSTSPPERIFHFKRDTSQLIRDSPPAVHPTKPLVVWPLGDNNILFADYKYNTYFVRKFRVSRLWSQHVSINCRFSTDGQYLHAAALEMRRNLPIKSKISKGAKGRGKSDAIAEEKKEMKMEKERPECDLLVSTYRLSERKTTRAPPVLLHRTQLPLGGICLAEGLPTFTWATDDVFVAYGVQQELQVFKIGLFKSASSFVGQNLPAVYVLGMPICIDKCGTRREVYFLPPCATVKRARVIITTEQPALKKIAISEGKPKATRGGDSSVLNDKQSDHDNLVAVDETGASREARDLVSNDGHHRNIILYVDVEDDLKGWCDFDITLLGMSVVGEGIGQMDIEMVKFDRTDDCDCGDD